MVASHIYTLGLRCLTLAISLGVYAGMQAATLPQGITKLPPPKERNLKFRVEATKSQYIYGEPLEVAFWLENSGSEVEYYWTQAEQSLVLESLTGRERPTCGPWMVSMPVIMTDSLGRISSSDLHALEPGRSTPRYFQDILSIQYFGKCYRCGDVPPGSYKLFGEYFTTDTVYINVVMPDDDYNLAALRLFQDSSIKGVKSRLHPVRDPQKLWALVRQYPDSPLAPRALGELARSGGDSAVVATNLLLMNYPTSSYCVGAVKNLRASDIPPNELNAIIAGLITLREWYRELDVLVKGINAKLMEIED